MVRIVEGQIAQHADHIRELHVEYVKWVCGKLSREYGIDVDPEPVIEQDMKGLHKYMPPEGLLLLAELEEHIVGCIGLHRLDQETGEIKRMYVQPPYRGKGIGRSLLEVAIERVRQIGYSRIRLDTARFLKEAHSLYRSAGFKEIEYYEGCQIPREWILIGCSWSWP